MAERTLETVVNGAIKNELSWGAGTIAAAANAVWEEGTKKGTEENEERPGYMRVVYDVAKIKANEVSRRFVRYVGPRRLKLTTM